MNKVVSDRIVDRWVISRRPAENPKQLSVIIIEGLAYFEVIKGFS